MFDLAAVFAFFLSLLQDSIALLPLPAGAMHEVLQQLTDVLARLFL